MKKVQIEESLFSAMVAYHLLEIEKVKPMIEKGLQAKLDAIVMRDLYSKYKIAPTEQEKEEARQAYLDKRGVLEDFRW